MRTFEDCTLHFMRGVRVSFEGAPRLHNQAIESMNRAMMTVSLQLSDGIPALTAFEDLTCVESIMKHYSLLQGLPDSRENVRILEF